MWKQQHKELQKTSYLWQAPQVVPIIPSLSHHPALLLLVSLHPHQLKNPDPIIFLACSIPEYICYFFKPYFLTQLKQRTSSNVRFQTGLERPGVQCVQYTISCWWQISIKWPFQQMDRLATWFGHLGVHCEASDQRERGNCGQGSKFCCTLSGDGCADADSVTPSSNTRRHTIVPWMEIFFTLSGDGGPEGVSCHCGRFQGAQQAALLRSKVIPYSLTSVGNSLEGNPFSGSDHHLLPLQLLPFSHYVDAVSSVLIPQGVIEERVKKMARNILEDVLQVINLRSCKSFQTKKPQRSELLDSRLPTFAWRTSRRRTPSRTWWLRRRSPSLASWPLLTTRKMSGCQVLSTSSTSLTRPWRREMKRLGAISPAMGSNCRSFWRWGSRCW